MDEKEEYEDEGKFLETEYPFLYSRNLLKGTLEVAKKSMKTMERMLKKYPLMGEKYSECITDMVDRQVVRKVPKEGLENYQRNINYRPHLAECNINSKSTPV